jgi:hypothetical protein
MKRNQVKIISCVTIATALLLSACSETEEVNTEITSDVVEDTTNTANDNLDELSYDPNKEYKVPTPADLFMALENIGASANFEFMNDPSIAGEYTDKKSKAMNLGVYIADLGYASNFEFGPDIVKYLKAADDLMSDLNITGAMDAELKDKLSALVASGNKEELSSLTSEPFYKAYDYLEKNEREAALRLIVAGGWVEGLYLLTNMVDEYEEGNQVIQEIANQALSVESVLGFLAEQEADSDVADVMMDLADIEIIFSELEFSEGDDETSTDENGTMMMSGGGNLSISSEQFNNLKSKVAELRNSITD